MKKLLILTTSNDNSLPLFFLKKPINLDIDVFLYEDEINIFEKLSKNLDSYQSIYARDPFNTSVNQGWEEKINPLLNKLNQLKITSIDNIRCLEDFLIEDKWQQYQLLSEFMPLTRLLTKDFNFSPDSQIIKKRISSRARGIFFNDQEVKKIAEYEEYIVQNKINIKQEYRIFCIKNKIISPAVYKSSKTPTTQVKINREQTKSIDHKLQTFIEKILEKIDFDFVGLDVALNSRNEYVLIEVNRSPQFTAYYETTHLNLASMLLHRL